MRSLAYVLTALSVLGTAGGAAALPYADQIEFVKVSDPALAVDLVRNGTLDMYYYGVSPDLVAGDTDGLLVYVTPNQNVAGLLLNPAPGDAFNPFQLTEVRFAMNYLLDRESLVNELLGGYGAGIVSPYTPSALDYLRTIHQTMTFAIHHDPDLARSMIRNAMHVAGAEMSGDVWTVGGSPVEVKVFIREDDALRAGMGESLARSLEGAGFVVNRTYGDLAAAYGVVYGSDPADHMWHVYTEGWETGLPRYDDVSLAVFYAPWAGNMPGSGNPAFWNYRNDDLDSVTRQLYNGAYTGSGERNLLLNQATALGMKDAVRVFAYSKAGIYVAHPRVEGIINHVGDGISNSFTPVNSRTHLLNLTLGVKHLSQSSWNPVGGYGDAYTVDIVSVLADPAVVLHPHDVDIVPLRVNWTLDTAGPAGSLPVPEGVAVWDESSGMWSAAEANSTTSVVTLNYTFSDWHHGPEMDMNDIMYDIYFSYEWAASGDDDRTQDPQYSAAILPYLDILRGVRQLDGDTLEVYLDYWHHDYNETGLAGIVWTNTPWEMLYAMEQMVVDGRAAFSSSAANAMGVNWLSVVDPDDVQTLREYLATFLEEGRVPEPLAGSGLDWDYYSARYRSAIDWIDARGHAFSSNGPLYLESYDADAGRAVAAAFRDASYPYEPGLWSHIDDPVFPYLDYVGAPDMYPGERYSVTVLSTDADRILYFLSGPMQGLVYAGGINATGYDRVTISGNDTADIRECSLTLQVFALSDSVIVPDFTIVPVDVAGCGPDYSPGDDIPACPPAESGDCGPGIEGDLYSLGLAEEARSMRAMVQLIAFAQENDIPVDDLMNVIDGEYAGRAAILLIGLLLEGEVEAAELLAYIMP